MEKLNMWMGIIKAVVEFVLAICLIFIAAHFVVRFW